MRSPLGESLSMFCAEKIAADMGCKVKRDGDMYICFGSGFTNLQESDDYAFGNTALNAINLYKKALETDQKGEEV